LSIASTLKYDSAGLIPAVIQDGANGQILMVGYMNEQAVDRTLESRCVTFWSRSRQQFWVKGEKSGNTQRLVSMRIDCDRDCLLLQVEQAGPACHEGYRSCFFREVDAAGESEELVAERLQDPAAMYGKR